MTHVFIAAVFPGQGSQTVGMLQDIAQQFSEVEETFAEASAVLKKDLWRYVIHGPVEILNQTEHAQPVLLAAAYAIWRIIQTVYPVAFTLLAGHSLGEYTALVCANVMDFSEAVRLVAERGVLMQKAVELGQGAMAAIIGLDEMAVSKICQEAVRSSEEILSLASLNSLDQIVVAGHRLPVERAVQLAKQRGAKKALILPVSVPAHCLLMKKAVSGLEEVLSLISLRAPRLPVISNVSAQPYPTIQAIREGLLTQLTSPVRWIETIQYCVENKITHVIECGPGHVLTDLNKRINPCLQCFSTHNRTALKKLLESSDVICQ